jgi:hypothetical protein
MQNFIVSILIKVLSDPKVQQTIKNLLSELITEKIAPLVPLAAASAAHAFANLIPGMSPLRSRTWWRWRTRCATTSTS